MREDTELLVEVAEGIATLALNRPRRRNALTAGMLLSLARALDDLAARGVRCAVLRGAGERAFSAGMDLSELPHGVAGDIVEQIAEKGPLQFCLQAIEEAPFPVIAMISGYCVGAGCEMSMACDLRVGAEGCRMGMPPARLGIVYPPEGLQRFLRVLGLPATRKLFLTASLFEAGEAREMGMLDYLVPGVELEGFTRELARDIAAGAPLSHAGHKLLLRALSPAPSLAGPLREEMEAAMGRALASEDAREGVAAFREKRDPVFRGE